MNLGRILANIIERKSESYSLQYSGQFDGFFSKINKIPDISSLKIDNILIITDQTPYSLISISYTVRLAEALGQDTKVYAITEFKHSEAIKKICQENNIKLLELREIKTTNVEIIHKFIDEHNIGLVIISYSHKLKQAILDKVSVSVLVTSLKNF